MTDLESPKKNNDCYFYYYSTCSKGDSCTFRHEPSALGCETTCSFWKEGKCLNVHCNFRHMELRKNRKAIACYWESQPGGCKKPHCPFMHQNAIDNNGNDKCDLKDKLKESDMKYEDKQSSESKMDSLVVNIEEESDSESTSNYSPTKPITKNVKVKTLEEIKLEKIQAESAAYYSYKQEQLNSIKEEAEDDLRQRLLQKMKTKSAISEKALITKRLGYFEVNNDQPQLKRQKIQNERKATSEIKIKTLEEIRAEKKREFEESDNSSFSSKNQESEAVVSSTSTDDVGRCTTTSNETKRRKIKLRRPVDIDENVSSETKDKDESQSNLDLPNKSFVDENMLLDEDEESSNLTIKAEDELLKEIDYLLND